MRGNMVIRSRRKRVKIEKKKSAAKPRKVRLAIECTPIERKYMKMLAAHEEMTLNEFVLESVRMRFKECSRSHIPNKKTEAALESAEAKKGLIHFDSIDDFFKSLEK